MRTTPKSKAVCFLSILILHLALSSPVVKRDVLGVTGSAGARAGVEVPVASDQVSLLEADVFGGQTQEGHGSREKRLLKTAIKLKALGLGAGLKAVGAGVKAVGALGLKAGAVGAKAVGKTAVKAATKVGVKVAKAAITIGIAKLLLNLVFGKINQLIDFKTRLLSGVGSGKGVLSSSNLSSLSSSSGSSGSSSGGGGGGGGVSINTGSDGQNYGDDATTDDGVAGGAYGAVGGDVGVSADVGLGAGGEQIAENLPVLDPEKISLEVPGDVFAKGFNIVNKGAPIFGDVIQRTANRLVTVAAALKPILGSSLGFRVGSRDTRSSSDAIAESDNLNPTDVPFTTDAIASPSSDSPAVPSELPSQFRRFDSFESAPMTATRGGQNIKREAPQSNFETVYYYNNFDNGHSYYYQRLPDSSPVWNSRAVF